jgi:hypothetical protein
MFAQADDGDVLERLLLKQLAQDVIGRWTARTSF